MARYAVTFIATAAHTVIVDDATSDEDARRQADELFEPQSLCHQCAGSIDLGDWDQDDSKYGVDNLDEPVR